MDVEAFFRGVITKDFTTDCSSSKRFRIFEKHDG